MSFSAILLAISCMKASKLSRPELSLSTWPWHSFRFGLVQDHIAMSPTSETIFLISSFLGSKPKALIATFKSLESITPWLAVSNRLKQENIRCHHPCHKVRSPESLLDVRLLLLSEIKLGRNRFSFGTSRHIWKSSRRRLVGLTYIVFNIFEHLAHESCGAKWQ